MAETWTSPPLASFEALAATIDARFGPPTARDVDSNGQGLFDAYDLRFSCGLEVVLWRFHLGVRLQTIDPAIEPSVFEIHANERDLEHVAAHLGIEIESMQVWSDREGVGVARAPRSFVVMRTDDNGNDAEVRRVTSRCEADALVRELESRGHKQSYWVAEPHGA